MVPFTIEFSDEEMEALKKFSADVGLSCEEVVKRIALRWLLNERPSFEDALEHTMNKNEELYKKLA